MPAVRHWRDALRANARPPQATSTIDETLKNDSPGYLASGGIRPDAVAPALTPEAARAGTSSYWQIKSLDIRSTGISAWSECFRGTIPLKSDISAIVEYT